LVLKKNVTVLFYYFSLVFLICVGLGFIFAPNFSSLSPEVAKDYIAGGEIMLIISFFRIVSYYLIRY
jgi:hypothetical protein